mmetsp:Transcript_37655/g.84175  ORF Transcript_37655/g.84175 Transcript_37655/m.84175 type:complete len:90 (+) Transcript_37655:359-628(+)
MFPINSEGCFSSDNESRYIETWHEMEKLVDEGIAKYCFEMQGLGVRQKNTRCQSCRMSATPTCSRRICSIFVTPTMLDSRFAACNVVVF